VEAIQSGVKDPVVFYQAGVCYQKSDDVNEQVKAIPYFEAALKDGKTLPVGLNYELGELYLKTKISKKHSNSLQLIKHLPKQTKKHRPMQTGVLRRQAMRWPLCLCRETLKYSPFPEI